MPNRNARKKAVKKSPPEKKVKSANRLIGSSFESYLKEQGTLTETTSRAIKRVLAYQCKSR